MNIILPSRGWLISLFISLAVNLLLLGVLAGRSGAAHFRDMSGHHPHFERTAEHPHHELDDPREQLHAHRSAMRDSRQRLSQLLSEDKPDLDAINRELDQIRERSVDFQMLGQRRFVDSMLALTPDERRNRLKRMQRRGEPGDGLTTGGTRPPPVR